MEKRAMRLATTSVLVAMLLIGVFSVSAEETPQNMTIIREAIRANKKLFVAQNMDLTVSEINLFWTVYDEYQKDLDKLVDRFIRVIDAYAKEGDALSNEASTSLLNEYLSIDAERVKLRQTYVPRFLNAIPAKKVMRYYQLENKFFAVVQYDLAARIPLIK